MILCKNTLRTIWLLAILLSGSVLHAQDLFFNQFHLAPLSTNPASPGMMGEGWLTLNSKFVPLTTGEKYTTTQAAAFFPVSLGDHRLVFSGSFFSDRVSDLLTNSGGTFGTALNLAVSRRSSLSFGTTFSYSGISLSEVYTTDSQFVLGTFDPSAPSGELFTNNSNGQFTISSGLQWQLNDANGDRKAFAGFSLYNFNRANLSFTDMKEDKSPVTYKFNAGFELLRSGQFAITPMALAISKNGNQWLQAGGLMSYDLLIKETDSEGKAKVGVGAWYNTNGITVTSIQYEQQKFIAAFSFDLPVGSNLESVRNNSFEIAIHYRITKKSKGSAVNRDPRLMKSPKTSLNDSPDFVKGPSKTDEKNSQLSNSPKTERQNTVQKILPITEEKSSALYPMPTASEKIQLKRNITFELGSEAPDRKSESHLAEVVKIFKKYDHLGIRLTGHSCAIGPEETNEKLSLQRAEYVKNYLIDRGLDPDRITTEGKGEEKPLSSNDDEDSRKLNRRVEVELVDLHK